MAKLWCTIALSPGLYAFTNLPWNEAILDNFLTETSCRKLVLPFFVLPWDNVRLKQKIPSPGQSFATCGKRIQRWVVGKWEEEVRGGIFVAGRMDGKEDKVWLKVGPVTVANERIKWWHLQWQMRLRGRTAHYLEEGIWYLTDMASSN